MFGKFNKEDFIGSTVAAMIKICVCGYENNFQNLTVFGY
jgi:hypothetical protein